VDRQIYVLPKMSKKKDFIFNMLGSLINAGVSVLLLIFVSRIGGEQMAGEFSLAYSTAQMMYTICVFEIRNIQVTDVRREYPFGVIGGFRLITTAAMWIFFAFFCAVKGFSGNTVAVMFILTLYMSALAFSDLFQGNMHLNGYLSLAGMSLAGEVILAFAVFAVLFVITRTLWISAIGMTVAVILWILLFDIPYNRKISVLNLGFDLKTQKNLFLCALPLFLSAFLHQYIFNSPKYAIDGYLSPIEQSCYGYLIMPTSFINLLSLFVFRPQLVSISAMWVNKERSEFIKKATFLFASVLIITVIVLGAGFFFGIPLLEFLYNSNLSGEKTSFMILLAAGGVSAFCTLIYTLMTVMRKQKYSLIAYGVAFVFAMFIPDYLVRMSGIVGAALSYLIEMAVLCAVMMALFIISLKKEK